MRLDGDDDQDDTLDLTTDQIIDDEADGPDDEDQDGDDTDATDPDDDGEGEEETVIGFADETDEEDEDSDGGNSVIRNLRAQLKEKTKRLRELETAAPIPAKIEVGPKPTLADCNYDEEAYEEQLDKWKADSAKAEEQTAAIEEENRRAQESWTNDLNAYAERKAKIGVPDYDDAESVVVSALNGMQQAVAIKAAADPAALVVALSKSPAKLAELAKIQDPIKLAVAIAKMEGSVKVMTKRKGPALDRAQSGSGKPPQAGDKAKQMEKLEKEADRTGDRTKLISFKKKHKL